MVRSPRVNTSLVLDVTRRQIQTFKDHPELEKGLLVPRPGLEEQLAKVQELTTTVESLDQALASARHDLRAARFRLKESAMGNIEQATLRYGRASAERESLGGKPANVERGVSKTEAKGE